MVDSVYVVALHNCLVVIGNILRRLNFNRTKTIVNFIEVCVMFSTNKSQSKNVEASLKLIYTIKLDISDMDVDELRSKYFVVGFYP